ncbi:MAG: monovalent cation/H+ antiporter complex subunit F [Myxococcales bacterium]
MTAWLWAAAGFALCLVPCAFVALSARNVVDRLVALEMTAVCETLCLLVLAEAFERTIFFDLAVALALLSFGGGLVFARFLERWL